MVAVVAGAKGLSLGVEREQTMDALHSVAIRLAPAVASGLVTIGVAQGHAEVIALGLVTAVVVVAEAIWKWRKKKGA